MDRCDYNSERKRISSQYFIDTLGKLHKFKGGAIKSYEMTSLHYEIAYDLFPEIEYCDDHLMNLGWVLVGSTAYRHPIIHKRPTAAQIKKLKKLDLYSRLCFLYERKHEYLNFDIHGALCE